MSIETQIETYRAVVYPWRMDHMDYLSMQFHAARFDPTRRAPVCRDRNAYEHFQANRRGMAALSIPTKDTHEH